MNRTPLLLGCIIGSFLDLGRLLVLLLVVDSSRLAVVALLLVFAVPGVVFLFATVVAGRCFHCPGDATSCDRPSFSSLLNTSPRNK